MPIALEDGPAAPELSGEGDGRTLPPVDTIGTDVIADVGITEGFNHSPVFGEKLVILGPVTARTECVAVDNVVDAEPGIPLIGVGGITPQNCGPKAMP